MSRIRDTREAQALSQKALAAAAGISRQSLAAIESGRASPSVAVALAIAQALSRSVEELFARPAEAGVVITGCAPPLGMLVDRLGPGYSWRPAASGAALASFAAGASDVAGVHGVALPRGVTAVSLTGWEAGLLVAPGNPLGIHGVADLARPALRLAVREPGSGARAVLDAALAQAGLSPRRLLAGVREVRGHLEAALAVASGTADVSVAMRPMALAAGLGFIPLAEERFDLVGRAADARVARVFDVVCGARFRRDLSRLGGYDARICGKEAA